MTPESVSPTENKLSKPKFCCTECPHLFNQKQDFLKHFRRHGSGDEFKCRHCSYATSQNWTRIKHEAIHKIKKVNKSVSKPKLNIHTSSGLIRTLLNSSTKAGGRKKYSRISGLLSPQEYRKLITGNPNFTYKAIYVSSGTPGGRRKLKTYKCDICPQAFRSVRAFLGHAALHGADQTYKCHICNYSVVNKMTMGQHMEAHAAQEGNPELLVFPKNPPRKHIAVATKSTAVGPKRKPFGS